MWSHSTSYLVLITKFIIFQEFIYNLHHYSHIQFTFNMYTDMVPNAQLCLLITSHGHTYYEQAHFCFLFCHISVAIPEILYPFQSQSWDSLPLSILDFTCMCIYIIIRWMATSEILYLFQSQIMELKLHTHIFLTLCHMHI